MAAVAAGAMATEMVDVTAGNFLLKESIGEQQVAFLPFFLTIQFTCRGPLRILSVWRLELMCLQTHEARLSR